MLFSIITVTKNAEPALPSTLDSLSIQRLQDLEWLVQDGASTDATLERIRAHPASEMGLQLVSELDGGIYDGMNRAVARAQGEWLFFLNAGDAFADADVLADVAAAADAGDSDLIVGEVLMQRAGVVTKHRSYAHLGPTRLLFDSLCHQAVFARRGLFERFGAFDTRYRYAADYDWLLRTIRGGARVKYLARLVARFDAGGAHVRAAARTAAENEAVRRAHASAVTLLLGRAWFQNTNRLRRVVGFESKGHRTLHAGRD